MKTANQAWVEAMMKGCNNIIMLENTDSDVLKSVHNRINELNLACLLALLYSLCGKDSIYSHIEGILFSPNYIEHIIPII